MQPSRRRIDLPCTSGRARAATLLYKGGFSTIAWTGCAVGVSIWSAGVRIGMEDESVVKKRRESVG
jgi:hypothetical protein